MYCLPLAPPGPEKVSVCCPTFIDTSLTGPKKSSPMVTSTGAEPR